MGGGGGGGGVESDSLVTENGTIDLMASTAIEADEIEELMKR